MGVRRARRWIVSGVYCVRRLHGPLESLRIGREGERVLASTAHLRFKNADSEQKRELIRFMCSNSSWVDGKLEVELHVFFDLMLNLVRSASQNEDETARDGLANVKTVDWWR